MPPPTAIFALPGTLALAGRDYTIPAPTATDMARVHDKMRELAGRHIVSPLQYVSLNREQLDPATHAEAVRAAVAMGAGGGVEPTRESVFRAYDTLEGVRWRTWYHISRADAAVKLADLEQLVTDENYWDVGSALQKALGLEQIEKKATSESGPK